MNDFKIDLNKNITPITKPRIGDHKPDKPVVNKVESFDEILKKQIFKEEKLKFSKHAQERLQRRNIAFTPQDLKNIDNAVEKAAKKGIKDTLIIMGNTALIANVRSKTVITATTEESLKDNIFTNIDGAVII